MREGNDECSMSHYDMCLPNLIEILLTQTLLNSRLEGAETHKENLQEKYPKKGKEEELHIERWL